MELLTNRIADSRSKKLPRKLASNYPWLYVRARNRMDVPDVTRVPMSFLSDEAISKLMAAGVAYHTSTFEDQKFWHDRVETLSQRRIEFYTDVDWNETYQILKRELARAKAGHNPSFWNKEDNATVLEILLSLGYKPEDSYGSLSMAVKHGSVNILHFLLSEGGIDPNDVAVMDHYPPLTLAADNAQPEAVKLLLADPRVDPNNDEGDTTALVQACSVSRGNEARYVEVVHLLLQDGRADPTWNDSKVLSVVSYFGDYAEIVRLLLEDGRADPSDGNGEALILASTRGREKIVALLLADPRTVPWAQDGEALIGAVEEEEASVVKLLLKDGRVNPSTRDGAALVIAAQGGTDVSLDVLKLLLSDDRTYAAINNNAALKAAIENENIEAVELLLEDADVLQELSEEDLTLAEETGNAEITQLVRSALDAD